MAGPKSNSVEYGSSTYTASYTYDGEARLVQLTDWIDGVDGLRYEYDDMGRLVEITDYDDSTLTYTYDDAGNVLTMTDYPPAADLRHGNTTTYTYNDIGQLDTLTAPGSKVWDYTYDTGNRLTRVDIPNGMHTEYAYDTAGRQDSIHHKDGSTVVQGFDYTFDNGSSITRIDHEDGSYWAYDYDGRERLIEAERYDNTPTLLHRYTYTYDDGDNMLTKAVYDPSGPTTVTTTYTYNDANEQITMDDGTTSIDMTYDEWGRLIEKDDGTYTATYAYRYGGKLYSVTSDFPGEGNVTYETGGDGKRRSRIAGASETWYNYDTDYVVLSEEDSADGSSGDLKRTYVGAREAHVDGTSLSSGAWKYYIHDQVWSSRGIWNQDGSDYASIEHTPFGENYKVSGSDSDITRRFTGHDWDESSDLYFAPFRHYSLEMSRWLSRDPLGMYDGPNLYSYVEGDPILFSDPLGLTRLTGEGRRARRECRRRLEDTLRSLAARCSCAGRYSGEPITGNVGITPGRNTGWSPRRGHIRIPMNWCGMDDRTFDWYVAHEYGHAESGFSRVRWRIDRRFRQNEENEADRFANECLGYDRGGQAWPAVR